MGNFPSHGHTDPPEPEEEAMVQEEDVEDVIPEERVPSTHRMRLHGTPWDSRASGFAYFLYDTDTDDGSDDHDDESRSGATSVDEQVASLSTPSTERASDTEVPVESVQAQYKDSVAPSCATDSSGVTASDENVPLVRGGTAAFERGRAVINTQVGTVAAAKAPEHVATLSSTISPPVKGVRKVAPAATPEPRASSTTTPSTPGESKMVSRLDYRARMRRMARQHETQRLRSQLAERVCAGPKRDTAVQSMRIAGGDGSTGGKASRRKERKASSLKPAPKPAPATPAPAPAPKTTATTSAALSDGENPPGLTGIINSKRPPSSPLKRPAVDRDAQDAPATLTDTGSRRVRSKQQAPASRIGSVAVARAPAKGHIEIACRMCAARFYVTAPWDPTKLTVSDGAVRAHDREKHPDWITWNVASKKGLMGTSVATMDGPMLYNRALFVAAEAFPHIADTKYSPRSYRTIFVQRFAVARYFLQKREIWRDWFQKIKDKAMADYKRTHGKGAKRSDTDPSNPLVASETWKRVALEMLDAYEEKILGLLDQAGAVEHVMQWTGQQRLDYLNNSFLVPAFISESSQRSTMTPPNFFRPPTNVPPENIAP